MFGADKVGFRAWHEKLVNIMGQVRPGSGGIIKALVRHVDHEVDEEMSGCRRRKNMTSWRPRENVGNNKCGSIRSAHG